MSDLNQPQDHSQAVILPPASLQGQCHPQRAFPGLLCGPRHLPVIMPRGGKALQQLKAVAVSVPSALFFV